MRILFVGPYPPAKDGIGTYTRVLGEAMREQGHEVAVLADRALAGAPAEVIGHLGGKDLAGVITRFKPDVVHVQFAVPAYGTRTPAVLRLLRLLRALGLPVTVTMHEVTRDTEILRFAGRALYRRVAALADELIVHTAAAGQVLSALSGREVKVIPHFTNEPPADGRSPAQIRDEHGLADHRILLMFGFIHVHKGLDDLVAALGLLRAAEPELLAGVRLAVAGSVRRRTGVFRIFELADHLHHARVRRLARRVGVADLMVSTSFVPDEDVAGWFRLSEAVVLPYRRAEQSGVASMAQAYGVPVIATTAGGLAELFAGSPWTAPPGRPDRLAALISDLLLDPARKTNSMPPPLEAARLEKVVESTLSVYQGGIDGVA